MVSDLGQPADRVREAGRLLARTLFGSVGRFFVILGVALLLAGYVRQDGVVAGHLGIYGASAVALGLLIRLAWLLRE